MQRRLMMLPKDEPYIVFADPVAEEFCATAFGDGVGLTKRNARKIKTAQFKTALAEFQDRTSITSFDEFRYFNHVGEAGAWTGCSLLTSITLPKSCTYLNWSAFKGCSSLTKINLENVAKMRGMAFMDCTNLRIAVNMPNLINITDTLGVDYQCFARSGITKVEKLGSITDIGPYSFAQGCGELKEVWLPKTIAKIGNLSFYQCNALESLVVLAINPPELYNDLAIGGAANRKIYVPYSSDHSIIAAYKSAPTWSVLESAIYELNQDGTIPTA